jgi:hypothetical protein
MPELVPIGAVSSLAMMYREATHSDSTAANQVAVEHQTPNARKRVSTTWR